MKLLAAALSLLLWLTASVAAQNSYPTAGGARVPALVVMCIASGIARPCAGTAVGPDSEFPTAGGATVPGRVQMCLVAGRATPCAGGGGGVTPPAAPTVTSVTPNNGDVAGGTSVSVGGTNLTGASVLTIGGNTATIGAVTPTTIATTTPAHAVGAVNVVVTTPGGMGTGPGLFTYTAAGTSAFDPASIGTGITLSNANKDATGITGASESRARGILGKSSGKWYFEINVIANIAGELFFGIADATATGGAGMDGVGAVGNEFLIRDDGFYISTASPFLVGGSVAALGTITVGTVIGVAVDVTNKMMWISNNNIYVGSGNPSTGVNPELTWGLSLTMYPECLIYNDAGGHLRIITSGTTYSPPSGFTVWG